MNNTSSSAHPRLIIAGLSGGSGKTMVSLGLARAWARSGCKVKPFKKGPDYIDAVWLGLAAGNAATNLDPYIMDPDLVAPLFLDRMRGFEAAVIEGNRGLYDGMDKSGSCSTAELARLLNAPVVVVMDCTKMTRTAAAIVAGLKNFEPNVDLAGVVLNRTAGERHRAMLTECISDLAGVPVLGALPKLLECPIPERHMGLVSNREYQGQEEILDDLADIMVRHLDMDGLRRVAEDAGALAASGNADDIWPVSSPECHTDKIRIAFVRDAALWFYYEENLEALSRAGAELVEVSLLDGDWPEIHGLYLGGGFPETLAEELARQEDVRCKVRDLALSGLPIYAECGGFMYLGQSVRYRDREWPMAGVFPVTTELHAKPRGLGYVEARVEGSTPFLDRNIIVRGHEFHYSQCVPAQNAELELGLKMIRGKGMIKDRDGLIFRNTFASYTHIHALGVREWAPNFVAAAQKYKSGA